MRGYPRTSSVVGDGWDGPGKYITMLSSHTHTGEWFIFPMLANHTHTNLCERFIPPMCCLSQTYIPQLQ